MTDQLPNYKAIEPPDSKLPMEYSTHERRADILRRIIDAGTPANVSQRRLAERYGVHDSTISRDMDKLREQVDAALGTDAKLTTLALFEKTVRELQREGEWKQAWDVAMDWNEWLADIGEQHREPQQSELDVDMTGEAAAYKVVRPSEADLPTTDDGTVDYEALGFMSAPGEIEMASPTDDDGTDAADGDD